MHMHMHMQLWDSTSVHVCGGRTGGRVHICVTCMWTNYFSASHSYLMVGSDDLSSSSMSTHFTPQNVIN